MNDYLDEIVKCPSCKKEVKDGDRIWLDGECLCPACYQHKRNKLTKLQNDSYNEGYDKGYDVGYNEGYNEGYLQGLVEGRMN